MPAALFQPFAFALDGHFVYPRYAASLIVFTVKLSPGPERGLLVFPSHALKRDFVASRCDRRPAKAAKYCKDIEGL